MRGQSAVDPRRAKLEARSCSRRICLAKANSRSLTPASRSNFTNVSLASCIARTYCKQQPVRCVQIAIVLKAHSEVQEDVGDRDIAVHSFKRVRQFGKSAAFRRQPAPLSVRLSDCEYRHTPEALERSRVPIVFYDAWCAEE